MAGNITPLDQLKSFLNEIFQFETQDLDFGIYKIMNYKRKEIRNFIDKLLVEKVKEQLKTISDDETKSIGLQLKELEKDDVIKGWLAAADSDKATLEKLYPDKFRLYHDLTVKAKDVKVSEETQNLIYNHLTQFFSRYYDKGDFISKRRFGKNEKYVVPYNGEETHFYWANHDQYYIKSSETFQHYAFRVSTHTGTLTVHFKLHNAQLEQGNVKADEPNFFMLAGKSPEIKENDEDLNFILADRKPEIGDHEVTFYFEYRPLDESEKAKIKGNNKQDTLDEIAFDFLKKEFSANPLFANLWKEQEGKPLLLKKLHHYTRKNKYDFFIHKNLKAFLERELDFYIKTELVNVDDLYVTDTEEHFDKLRHNLKTIKVFKSIADTIIDFVHQIEDFQKKLWEKKKFVISTEWVITIDRLVEYLNNDEKLYRLILEEVVKNKDQVAEWKNLFGEENIPEKLSVDSLKADLHNCLKADLHNWKKLPVDTCYFNKNFKTRLLNNLSLYVDLEKIVDGLVINSDNYHGLNLIKGKFTEKIKCCYIDPPYNGKSSEIIYKNTFKHSSWAVLMQNRINESKELLLQDSVDIIAIDENEIEYLGLILKGEFGDKKITCIPIIINPGGTQDDNFAYVHDYAYFVYNPVGKQIAFENREDSPDIRNFMNTAKGNTENYLRESGANCFYPIYIKDETIIGFGDVCEEDFHPSSANIANDEIIEVYPIDIDGVERKWVFARNTVEQIVKDLRPKKNKKTGQWEIERVKSKLNFKTVWTDNKYSAKTYGTGILKSILGKDQAKNFSFPKSIYTVYDSLKAGLNEKLNGYILDYFAGSGTTFHATQILNSEDKGDRKCILIEQGNYVFTVIIPRIKKIAYSFDWKDGKPKNGIMNGTGVFFKYQRLEQYEEALENIAFNAPEDAVQKALEFDQYIPKYFLEFETKESNTLVNTEAMKDPWNYRLKVWDGFTYDTEKAVDLVETFNYLIGLHMQKCITKEINGRMYQFIYGNNNANKQILVIWRNVKGWTPDDYTADSLAVKKELANYKYDLLYINDQAHIDGYQPIEEVFKNKMLN